MFQQHRPIVCTYVTNHVLVSFCERVLESILFATGLGLKRSELYPGRFYVDYIAYSFITKRRIVKPKANPNPSFITACLQCDNYNCFFAIN